ncbi:MAG: ABC transporter permease [Candidatus Omnitrophota bacterium]|jgi:lipopolysaccharide transport system permease protein
MKTIHLNQRQDIISLLNPVITFCNIWHRRDLLRQLVLRNIQIRYKGTAIGLIWMVITPLIMLSVYTFVFSVIFKARWGTDFGDSKAAFALIIFCGIVVFNIFSESVTGSVGGISGNPNYVKKVVFPLEILPVSIVFSSMFFGLVSVGILLVGVALFLHTLSITVICLPVVLTPLFLLSCGIAWFVASLGVYIRDLTHIIGIVMQILFFMTPIFYNIDMVPEKFQHILNVNPLTPIVQMARDVLIYSKWPHFGGLAAAFLISLAVFQIGYVWFMKTKRGFADVV